MFWIVTWSEKNSNSVYVTMQIWHIFQLIFSILSFIQNTFTWEKFSKAERNEYGDIIFPTALLPSLQRKGLSSFSTFQNSICAHASIGIDIDTCIYLCVCVYIYISHIQYAYINCVSKRVPVSFPIASSTLCFELLMATILTPRFYISVFNSRGTCLAAEVTEATHGRVCGHLQAHLAAHYYVCLTFAGFFLWSYTVLLSLKSDLLRVPFISAASIHISCPSPRLLGLSAGAASRLAAPVLCRNQQWRAKPAFGRRGLGDGRFYVPSIVACLTRAAFSSPWRG